MCLDFYNLFFHLLTHAMDWKVLILKWWEKAKSRYSLDFFIHLILVLHCTHKTPNHKPISIFSPIKMAKNGNNFFYYYYLFLTKNLRLTPDLQLTVNFWVLVKRPGSSGGEGATSGQIWRDYGHWLLSVSL